MPFPYRLDDEISAEREEFIHQNLQVPLSWIAKAKATRAAFEGRSGDQAWFLIRASEWNAAHEVVVKEIAPDAIIADNYEFFYELLKELEEASESITNWNIRGKCQVVGNDHILPPTHTVSSHAFYFEFLFQVLYIMISSRLNLK